MHLIVYRKVMRFITFAITATIVVATPLSAAVLHKNTVAAWSEYVQLTEKRINQELRSPNGFLVQDFQEARKATADRKAVLSGNIIVDRMKTRYRAGTKIAVPDGMIHHWRGSVFIPNVPLEVILAQVRDPGASEHRQQDVLESRILWRSDDTVLIYLKLVRSKIVTVTYNTEHLVNYRAHGSGRASSRSTAIKIAELEGANTPHEREKPEGRDRGFLWRLNSYWRYVEVNGGVLVECESLTLSRGIPTILKPLVRPIVNRIARESMRRTLSSMRERFASEHVEITNNKSQITNKFQ